MMFLEATKKVQRETCYKNKDRKKYIKMECRDIQTTCKCRIKRKTHLDIPTNRKTERETTEDIQTDRDKKIYVRRYTYKQIERKR